MRTDSHEIHSILNAYADNLWGWTLNEMARGLRGHGPFTCSSFLRVRNRSMGKDSSPCQTKSSGQLSSSETSSTPGGCSKPLAPPALQQHRFYNKQRTPIPQTSWVSTTARGTLQHLTLSHASVIGSSRSGTGQHHAGCDCCAYYQN